MMSTYINPLVVLGEKSETILSQSLFNFENFSKLDDSPYRFYFTSKTKGLECIFENNIFVEMHIYLQPFNGYDRCEDELPFDLTNLSKKTDLFEAIGNPAFEDDFSVTHYLENKKFKLVTIYDKNQKLKFASFSLTQC